MTFNLAETICSKHQDATFRIALEEVRLAGSNTYTFGGLDYLSDKFATGLRNCSIKQGDVVAVVLPPSAAFVVAHFATLKLGAIVAPVSIEIEPSLLEQLVIVSQAKAIILDEAVFKMSEYLLQDLNEVELFIASDYVSKNKFGDRGKGFWYEINFADADFKIAAIEETTPAYIFFEQDESNIFTGSIYTHGFIVKDLRSDEKRDDFACNEETPIPAPIDWSSKTVLFDLLYPAWFCGCSIETASSTP
jgi:acetyl-CoA synthetase